VEEEQEEKKAKCPERAIETMGLSVSLGAASGVGVRVDGPVHGVCEIDAKNVKGLLELASCDGDKQGTGLIGGCGEEKNLCPSHVVRGDEKMDVGLLKPAMTGRRHSSTDRGSSDSSNSGSLLKHEHGCTAGDMVLTALNAGWMPTTLDVQACHQASATYLSDLQQQVQSFLGQGAQAFHLSGWGPPGTVCAPAPGIAPGIDQLLKNTLEYYFSDANLHYDNYLKGLMVQGQGWVPLVVLQSFPRMQQIGVDTFAMGQALLRITSLELDATAYYVRIRDWATREKWLASAQSQLAGLPPVQMS